MQQGSLKHTTNSEKQAGYLLWAFIIFVCVADAAFDFLVRPHVDPLLNTNLLLIFVDPLWKLLFWLVPSFLYVRYTEAESPLDYLKLKRRIGWGLLWGTLVSGLIIALTLVDKYLLLHHPFGLQSLTANQWLNVVILVGFMEEIPFRGVIFQKLQARMHFWWAALLNATIFLTIHIIYWISLGKSPLALLNGALSIILFAIIACALLKLTRSLWSSIIFHALYDLSTIFFT